jgi:hypothetical protein
VPGPVDAVGARRPGRRHAVLRAGHAEVMAADPGMPGASDEPDHRILHARLGVAGECHARGGMGQVFQPVGFYPADPPVEGVWCRAADVQAPATGREADEGGTLHHRGAELLLVDLHDRVEAFAIRGTGDDVGVVRTTDAPGQHDGAIVIQGGARRAGPLLGTRRWRRGDDGWVRHAGNRQRGHGASSKMPGVHVMKRLSRALVRGPHAPSPSCGTGKGGAYSVARSTYSEQP